MKKKRKKKIHIDKKGREYIKEAYFVGGKMKFHRIYVTEGIPIDEFYEKNANDIDHFINEEYHLISNEQDYTDSCNESNNQAKDISGEDIEDLPF